MVTQTEVLALQAAVKTVRVDEAIADYLLRLVGGTRTDTRLRTGLSPRGSLTLYRTAQARARTEGRDFVTPDDVRALAVPVLAHRMQLDSKAKYAGQTAESILREALETLPVPR